MKMKTTVNDVALRRGIKPGIWYGNIFCHGVQFKGITGWRSPRIKKWKSSYINMTETPGDGPSIVEARTLKDCVFETQLHLLPDKKRTRLDSDADEA